jgi:hypothetical protein
VLNQGFSAIISNYTTKYILIKSILFVIGREIRNGKEDFGIKCLLNGISALAAKVSVEILKIFAKIIN